MRKDKSPVRVIIMQTRFSSFKIKSGYLKNILYIRLKSGNYKKMEYYCQRNIRKFAKVQIKVFWQRLTSTKNIMQWKRIYLYIQSIQIPFCRIAVYDVKYQKLWNCQFFAKHLWITFWVVTTTTTAQ